MKDFIKIRLNEMLSNTSYTAYHGSPKQINKFVDDFVGGKDATDQNGPGIYFTSSIKNARSYSGFIYEVKLSPKKVVSTKTGKQAPMKEIEWLIRQAPNWQDTAQNWHETPNIGVKLAAKDMVQYNDTPHDQFQQVWYDFYRYNAVDYVINMTKLGYDAIIIENLNSMLSSEENVTHTIVLNPAIITFVKMTDDRNEDEKKAI